MLIQSMMRSAVVASVGAWLFVLAPLGSAQAYESALDACRKWTGQGAGVQYRCFDCIKRVDAGSSAHWVNTCPEYSGGGWSWDR